MTERRAAQLKAFEKILDIMDELREKCPWDRKQTIETLRPLTIEETFELSDAINKNDYHNISKELGDILLHIIFYAKIGEEQGKFSIVDVIEELSNKLIYRHPHVFSDTKVKDAGEVIANWEQLKTKEKDGNKTILSGVPDAMPSMIKAYRMQDKARAVGFDWTEKEQVWDKVAEELGEFREEMLKLGKAEEAEDEAGKATGRKHAEQELGDLIFSIINAARLYHLNPDTALESTCTKFKRRFTYLEQHTIRKGLDLKQMSLEEMDKYWDEAKAMERE